MATKYPLGILTNYNSFNRCLTIDTLALGGDASFISTGVTRLKDSLLANRVCKGEAVQYSRETQQTPVIVARALTINHVGVMYAAT